MFTNITRKMSKITVVTMSGKKYAIELENNSTFQDLENQVNKLTGIRFVEQELENVYGDEERERIKKHYEENGPVFIHTTANKFVDSIDECKDGDVLRVVMSKR